jgi:hypothetical protein
MVQLVEVLEYGRGATPDSAIGCATAAEFRAQACGAPMSDGRWTAWVEFIPLDGGQPLRSPRETTQPNRTDAEYWAGGLTPVYLEGALHRAQSPLVQKRIEPAEPAFDEPAADLAAPYDSPPHRMPSSIPYPSIRRVRGFCASSSAPCRRGIS